MKASYLIGILLIVGVFSVDFLADEENYQDYDMYVFALQWGGNYCYTKSGSDKSKCEKLLEAVPRHKVSIHGLWPSLQSGKRLKDCNQGETIEIIDDGSDVFQDMKKYWTTLEPKNTNKYFWEHEYNKHGYCYSEYIHDMDPKTYFRDSLKVFHDRRYEDIIIDLFGDHKEGTDYVVPYDTFVASMNSYFGVDHYTFTCKTVSKKNYLSEIRVNLDLNFEYCDSDQQSSCSKKDIHLFYY